MLDPDVEGFLALLATRRAPKTVEAYRRDLTALAAWLDRPDRTDHDRAARAVPRRASRRRAVAGDDRPSRRGDPLVLPPPDAARSARRQPRRGPRAPPARAHTAAHAVARGGRAARRGCVRLHAQGTARPRARRAPLRRRLARQRGRRPPEVQRRPRRAPRALHRQGLEGAHRPCRAPGGAGAPPLPLSRQAVPRRPPPPGALPQRQGRRPDARRRVPDPAQPRRARPASSRNVSTRTCCGIPSRRISWRAAPTSVPSRKCSGTPISRRPSSTRTYPIGAVGSCTSRRTPTRGGRPSERHGTRSEHRMLAVVTGRRVPDGRRRPAQEHARVATRNPQVPQLRSRDPGARLQRLLRLALRGGALLQLGRNRARRLAQLRVLVVVLCEAVQQDDRLALRRAVA